MDIVEILAGPENLLELLKCASPFRKPVLIRRQIAGNDDRTGIGKPGCGIDGISVGRIRRWYGTVRKPAHRSTGRHSLTEGAAARQVGRGVSFCTQRVVQKVRVPVVRVVEVWRAAGGVAAIAVSLRVDNEAS